MSWHVKRKVKRNQKVSKHHSTDIEELVTKLLLSMSINFKREYLIGNYPVDFYLYDFNLSIQVDGCFHHLCPICNKEKKTYSRQIFQKRRDKACLLYHKYQKINIIRVKGCLLKKDIKSFQKELQEAIKQIKLGKLINKTL